MATLLTRLCESRIHATARIAAAGHRCAPVASLFSWAPTYSHTPTRSAAPNRLLASPAPGVAQRRSIAASASSTGSSSPSREVRVSHILLPPGQEPQLAELRAQLEAGSATLEDLAAAHSACPSRTKGGDIGWIPRGRTVPEFESAAYSTPVGGLVECTTKFGVHLLKETEEREAVEVGHCTVQELEEVLAAVAADPAIAADVQFIDVREPFEVSLASLPKFRDTVLPLSEFQEWAPTVAAGTAPLDSEKETYVLCHHGVRSMQVSQWLVANAGFKRVRNVTGGIDAYSIGVDASVPRY